MSDHHCTAHGVTLHNAAVARLQSLVRLADESPPPGPTSSFGSSPYDFTLKDRGLVTVRPFSDEAHAVPTYTGRRFLRDYLTCPPPRKS